ncbi:MAG: hypothetical protein AAGA88_05865 [Pseudomonadota bacterium]
MSMVSQYQPDEQPVDYRSAERRRVLIGGKILMENGRSTFDAKVRNSSDTGFLIETASTALIPNTFTLLLGIQAHQYLCSVEWRTETLLGVSIVGLPSASSQSQQTHQLTRVSGRATPPRAMKTTDMDERNALADRLAQRFPHLARKR